MIKINLIKSKIINYNYINFITFMHYKVIIFHNNKPNFIIISFIININKKTNKTTIINITNNKPIFIIIYFIINNTINKTTNLKRKFIIHKILIFTIKKNHKFNNIKNILFTIKKINTLNINTIINKSNKVNNISNTRFSNITSYKVALSYNNTLIIL